ncbi:MAG: ABC transporter ATP-binding protein [Deltaproteobacteria bacterium]
MAFLELKNIAKSFSTSAGLKSVLKGVNLSIHKGEFVSIVGYSGSGKTTLISLVAGLLKPDEGEILLEGKRIESPGPDRGVIFQNYSLLPWMTVFENVYLAVEAVAVGLGAGEKKERAEYYIRMVKLQDAMRKRPSELSGGMRQRVAVARGFAMEPKALLLDEPFSALDALTRATLQDELARIWAETGKTVVMITNDVDEAILLANRIFPLTSAPSATLGCEIPVSIPRPRIRRDLNLDPEYQKARRSIVDFLIGRRASRDKRASSISDIAQMQRRPEKKASILQGEI